MNLSPSCPKPHDTASASGNTLKERDAGCICCCQWKRVVVPFAINSCCRNAPLGICEANELPQRAKSSLEAFPTSWPNMPSADFCSAVRMPRGTLSRRSDTEQISRGKFNRLLRTVAGSTLRVLDGYGLRGKLPARPTLTPCIRFLSIDSRICSTLPSDPASRR